MKPGTARSWIPKGLIGLTILGILLIGRRLINLLPALLHGYQGPPVSTTPAARQFAQLDDLFAHYAWITAFHILPALVFILSGPFQFNRKLRKQHPGIHRRNGRLFFISGAIVGLTGVGMSLFMPSIGGLNQAAATLLFGIFFLISLYKGYRHIRKGQTALHREWMIRAYSIGLSVISIRPIIGIFFATSLFSHLTPRQFFGTGFWIGFVLQAVAAEVWIQYSRPLKRSMAAPAKKEDDMPSHI
jgi:uncharacterized membrane protein